MVLKAVQPKVICHMSYPNKWQVWGGRFRTKVGFWCCHGTEPVDVILIYFITLSEPNPRVWDKNPHSGVRDMSGQLSIDLGEDPSL